MRNTLSFHLSLILEEPRTNSYGTNLPHKKENSIQRIRKSDISYYYYSYML